MDARDLEAFAPLMLDDLEATLAPYGVDAADPEAMLEALAALSGVLLARSEALAPWRRADIRLAMGRALAQGADLGPACPPGCPCTDEAA